MSDKSSLHAIHHVAIPAVDIATAVEWYTSRFSCKVEWQDESWALLAFENIKLALVTPGKHPVHIAFEHEDAASFGELEPHRDGTSSVYIEDAAGNAVEIIQK
jgi:catechol 2,3-dioxygenase-like lactoylglutathione lyase family enzyme